MENAWCGVVGAEWKVCLARVGDGAHTYYQVKYLACTHSNSSAFGGIPVKSGRCSLVFQCLRYDVS